MKKKKNIADRMRIAFTKLWTKKVIHKNKKKYIRKPKHQKNENICTEN